MNAVLAIARKDLKLLFRDGSSLFWILGFPIAYAVFFGVIFGNEGGGGRGALSVIAVDEDATASSRALIARLDKSESVRMARSAEDPDGPPTSVELEVARELVQKGQRAAYLRVPSGYGSNPYAVFGAGPEGVALQIGIDPSRQAEAGFLQGVLMEAAMGALQERFTDKELLLEDLSAVRAEVRDSTDLGGAQKLTLQAFLGALNVFVEQFDLTQIEDSGGGAKSAPLEIVDVTRQRERGPRSSFEVTFPQAVVWGLMSVAMTFAILLVRERTVGTLVRLRMAPITRTQLLAGKALACFAGCLLTMLLLLAFSAIALGVRFDSPALLAVAMLATAACFTGLTMFVSVLGKTESAVSGSAWGVMMPFAMIGGGMIPLIAMPDWLVTASGASPFKWAIIAVEGATWRGFGMGDMALPCGILLAIGAVSFWIGARIFRRFESTGA